MLRSRTRFRRTTILTIGLISVLGGLGFSKSGRVLPVAFLVSSLVILVVCLVRVKVAISLAVILVGFLVGWWRGQMFLHSIEPLKTLNGKHIVATVLAQSDAVYDKRKELSFDADRLQISSPVQANLPGRLLIAGFGEPAIYKGDVVRVEGKLFVARGSRQYRMSFAEIKVLGRSGSVVDSLRRQYSAGMESALPEPQASFGLGLLIGQRSTLPANVSLALSTVGLTHVIAVSGYNLTIIMRAVRRMLRKRSKYQITIISFTLMTLFLLTTGFSASIVRAAVVSGLSLLAWYYGRNFRPVLLIALAAVITAIWNPFYLWSDVGWWLSFLAFFGVLVMAPLIIRRFMGTKQTKAMTGLLVESLSALVMTIPLVMYIFHQISLIALVANLLIVPLVPLAMLLALVAGLAGMILPVISGVIAWPAKVLLTYMLDLVQLMSRIPHALVKRQISLLEMLFLYGCIGLFTLVLWRTTEKKHDTMALESLGE